MLDDSCLKDIGDVLHADYPRGDSEISESEFSHRDPNLDYDSQQKVCMVDKDLKLTKDEKVTLKELNTSSSAKRSSPKKMKWLNKNFLK